MAVLSLSSSQVSSVNLTTAGTLDWVLFDRTGTLLRKAGGLGIAGDIYAFGDVTPRLGFATSDGESGTGTPNVIYTDGVGGATGSTPVFLSSQRLSGDGFVYPFVADTFSKVHKIYLGATSTMNYSVTAHLSDGSAAAIGPTSVSAAASGTAIELVLTVQAGSAAQWGYLVVKAVIGSASPGNMRVCGIAISGSLNPAGTTLIGAPLAVTIANAGFEAPVVSGGPDFTAVTSWTIGNALGGVTHAGSSNLDGQTPPEGNQVAAIMNQSGLVGSLTQSVTLPETGFYGFSVQSSLPFGATQDVVVTVAGTTIATLNFGGDNLFRRYVNGDFAGTSGANALALTGQWTGADFHLRNIDAVTLTRLPKADGSLVGVAPPPPPPPPAPPPPPPPSGITLTLTTGATSPLSTGTAYTFTVGATGGTFSGTITPTITGGSGTFSPTSLTGPGTFTLTPTSGAADAVIGLTNTSGASNPTGIHFTISGSGPTPPPAPPPGTLPGYVGPAGTYFAIPSTNNVFSTSSANVYAGLGLEYHPFDLWGGGAYSGVYRTFAVKSSGHTGHNFQAAILATWASDYSTVTFRQTNAPLVAHDETEVNSITGRFDADSPFTIGEPHSYLGLQWLDPADGGSPSLIGAFWAGSTQKNFIAQYDLTQATLGHGYFGTTRPVTPEDPISFAFGGTDNSAYPITCMWPGHGLFVSTAGQGSGNDQFVALDGTRSQRIGLTTNYSAGYQLIDLVHGHRIGINGGATDEGQVFYLAIEDLAAPGTMHNVSITGGTITTLGVDFGGGVFHMNPERMGWQYWAAYDKIIGWNETDPSGTSKLIILSPPTTGSRLTNAWTCTTESIVRRTGDTVAPATASGLNSVNGIWSRTAIEPAIDSYLIWPTDTSGIIGIRPSFVSGVSVFPPPAPPPVTPPPVTPPPVTPPPPPPPAPPPSGTLSISAITVSPGDVDSGTSGVQVYAGSTQLYSVTTADTTYPVTSSQWSLSVNGGAFINQGAPTTGVGLKTISFTYGSLVGYVWKHTAINSIGNTVFATLAVTVIAAPPSSSQVVRVVIQASAANATGVMAQVFVKASDGHASPPLFTQGFATSPNTATLTLPGVAPAVVNGATVSAVTVDIPVPVGITPTTGQVVEVTLTNKGNVVPAFSTLLIDGVVV